jgi:hypothetical protein
VGKKGKGIKRREKRERDGKEGRNKKWTLRSFSS